MRDIQSACRFPAIIRNHGEGDPIFPSFTYAVEKKGHEAKDKSISGGRVEVGEGWQVRLLSSNERKEGNHIRRTEGMRSLQTPWGQGGRTPEKAPFKGGQCKDSRGLQGQAQAAMMTRP